MAATFSAPVVLFSGETSQNSTIVTLVTMTPDSSYGAGGYSLPAGSAGVTTFKAVIPSVRAIAAKGYVVQWDSVNKKVMFFCQDAVDDNPLLECHDSQDLSTVLVDLLIIGV